MTLYWLQTKAFWIIQLHMTQWITKIIIDILEHCGIWASSMTWSRSYLSGRSFSVLSDTGMLATVNLTYSLPQRCTLGPLLYITYASKMQDVAERHGVGFHGYADNTQVRNLVQMEEASLIKQVMTNCVAHIVWSWTHASQKLSAWAHVSNWLVLALMIKVPGLPDGALQPSTTVKNLQVSSPQRYLDNGR